jgi:hypothetical protein
MSLKCAVFLVQLLPLRLVEEKKHLHIDFRMPKNHSNLMAIAVISDYITMTTSLATDVNSQGAPLVEVPSV